jgi:hypothetical protein
VLYVPKLDETTLVAVIEVIEDRGSAVVYSWQPALLRQHIDDERASFQPIPQTLINRFGAGFKP